MYYLDKILVLFIYAVIGLVFLDIVYCHIKELEWKVWDIDPRFIPKLWIWIEFKKPTKMKFRMLTVACAILWPVTCLAAMIKAENEYSIIQHHVTNKRKSV